MRDSYYLPKGEKQSCQEGHAADSEEHGLIPRTYGGENVV